MPLHKLLTTPRGKVTLIHNPTPADIEAHPVSPGLRAIMRDPNQRHTLLRRQAADPNTTLTIAVAGGQIVGATGIGPSFGRWRPLPHVREIAYEVAREWRHTGVAARMSRVALADPVIEDTILLAFLSPPSWDAAHEQLSLAGYRRRLESATAQSGFLPVGTDEPEVLYQESAALHVRIGARVPPSAIATFQSARYLRPAA